MKQIILMGVNKRFHTFIFVGTLLSLFLISCDPNMDNLGVDIFPPNDTILIHTDTITNIETKLVSSRPWVTSVKPSSSTQSISSYFLGSMIDTLTGLSKAEIVTEFGISQIGNFGDEPTVDSLSLSLYIDEVIGDTAQDMHITIYEFLDSLDIDSLYFSDYDISGKYNPDPLVDEIIVPKPATLYEFELNNQDLLDRILTATNPDDSIFIFNSRLQRHFHGLYIKTETVTTGGALAKIQLANYKSGLTFKYLHDSITENEADTVRYSTYTMSFNDYYAQKVNIFHHDFSGTYIESMIDNPDTEPQIAYVQGMTSINVKITLPDIVSYLNISESDKVAINSANLIFYVLPDSISGIAKADYPERLMMDTQLSDGSYSPLYDYLTNTNAYYFGKLTQSNKQSAFLDPVYYYNFHIGRHLQSVIAGDIENSDLIIFVDQSYNTSKIIKFWSNYSGKNGGLKLELIYTKF